MTPSIVLNPSELQWLLERYKKPDLSDADLTSIVTLGGRSFAGFSFRGVALRGVSLRGVNLQECDLSDAQLQGAVLSSANLSNARLHRARLDGADLVGATLDGAHLEGAHLDGANLTGATLIEAHLDRAHLEGANLTDAILVDVAASRADSRMVSLCGAFLDPGTTLTRVGFADTCGVGPALVDIRWGGANLEVVNDWRALIKVGEEVEAMRHERLTPRPPWGELLELWSAAARANQQIASALRANGLNELAGRFSYRSRSLQRQVWRCRGAWNQAVSQDPVVGAFVRWLGARHLTHLGSVIDWSARQLRRAGRKTHSLASRGGSLLLAIISGYGYRVTRTVGTYALVIGIFSTIYAVTWNEGTNGPRWPGVLVFSVLSFHGRGVGNGFQLADWVTRWSALEGVIGFVIEIIVIATFTQRMFRD